jgi:hypothetical protein
MREGQKAAAAAAAVAELPPGSSPAAKAAAKAAAVAMVDAQRKADSAAGGELQRTIARCRRAHPGLLCFGSTCAPRLGTASPAPTNSARPRPSSTHCKYCATSPLRAAARLSVYVLVLQVSYSARTTNPTPATSLHILGRPGPGEPSGFLMVPGRAEVVRGRALRLVLLLLHCRPPLHAR